MEVYIEKYTGGNLNTDGVNDMRSYIMDRTTEIEAQFNPIVQTQIFDGSPPSGTKYGYSRKEKIYRIQVDWNEDMNVIGTGPGSRIALSTVKFDKDLDVWQAKQPPGIPLLTEEEKKNVAATTLTHEMVHSISNRNFFRYLLQHEPTGLMAPVPSVSDARDGILPFSARTVKKLQAAVGTRF